MGGDRAVTIAAWATDTKLCGDVTLDCNFPSLSRPPPPPLFKDSEKLNKLIEADPSIAKEMLYSLSKEVFRMSKLRTPLLEQVGLLDWLAKGIYIYK